MTQSSLTRLRKHVGGHFSSGSGNATSPTSQSVPNQEGTLLLPRQPPHWGHLNGSPVAKILSTAIMSNRLLQVLRARLGPQTPRCHISSLHPNCPAPRSQPSPCPSMANLLHRCVDCSNSVF